MIIFGAAFVVLYLVFGLGFRLGQASLPKRIIFDIDHMDEGFASTDPPAYSTLARRYRITPPKLSEGFRPHPWRLRGGINATNPNLPPLPAPSSVLRASRGALRRAADFLFPRSRIQEFQ